MATWQQKGVVPDSEDEDEDCDSQSIVSEDASSNGLRLDELNGLDYAKEGEASGIVATDRHVDDGEEEPRVLQVGSHEQGFGGNGDNVAERKPHQSLEIDDKTGEEPTDSLLPRTESLLHSSPELRTFRVPLMDDVGANTVFPSELLKSDTYERHGVPESEEISKSYVRITSPDSESSQPSSSPETPPTLPPQLDSAQQGPMVNSNVILDHAFEIPHDLMSPAKRSLRHRKPIQLHPYAIEQEKYRHTLRARGVAPTRLISSQERPRSSGTKSPDPESQNLDSQELLIDTGESQAMDFDWNFPSSPPERRAESLNLDEGPPRNDSDDDLPDIRKVLSGNVEFPRLALKPKPTTCSKKFKRHVLPKTRPLPATRPANAKGRPELDIFDFPASPPTTSSPFPTTSKLSPLSFTRAASILSSEPTPSLRAGGSMDVPNIFDLSTPVTSATKPVSDLLPLKSDTDSDDPFASEPEARRSASSSSDESVRIRRNAKKFRGVLPASHVRLDHNAKPGVSNRLHRDILTASPTKGVARRGVALPRLNNDPSPTISTSTRLAFLSDSDGYGYDDDSFGFIQDDNPVLLESLFPKSRLGVAKEENRVDAMLPTRKRRSTGTKDSPRKKRRSGTSSLLCGIGGSSSRPPRTTNSLDSPRQSTGHKKSASRPLQSAPGIPQARRIQHKGLKRPIPPKLGILDVTDTNCRDHDELPQFIKIAARSARARKGQGRQSPSGKTIKLATREDTRDAHSVLLDWKMGRIRSRDLESVRPQSKTRRHSLQSVQQNQQNQQTIVPGPKLEPELQALRRHIGNSGLPRKIALTRDTQRSMRGFVTNEQPPKPTAGHRLSAGPAQQPKRKLHRGYRQARPAQLEATETDCFYKHPASAFTSTKKVLDTLYRKTRKRLNPPANLQLTRFLADGDAVKSTELGVLDECELTEDQPEQKEQAAQRTWRLKKRTPQRIDAGALKYRQPNDPLILRFLDAPQSEVADGGSKLLGLGKFGASYSRHFDIFPLQPGIFFHASTLIGGHRLAEALQRSNFISKRLGSCPVTIRLADTNTSWGSWDESVSSEIGLCFDCLLDPATLTSTIETEAISAKPIEIVMHVLDYVQYHLKFDAQLDRSNFLSRMIGIMQEFPTRFVAKEMLNQTQARQRIIVLSICTILALHLLMMARGHSDSSALSFELEDVLKSVSRESIGSLLSEGLDGVRKMYDDLQYLSFRQAGLQADHYHSQGWVIVMKALEFAQIPKASFWDIANSQLIQAPLKDINDARIMEKIWYTMFTLLPLSEFDEYGVVSIPRQLESFDNWSLSQQLIKRVLDLYKSNSRQLPGFNDYCRTVVGRCYHLMVEWGWWKSNAITGTLFDFFASQRLAHLRNEEVYTSPNFLESLAVDPDLTIQPGDRCFHIFLKMVGAGIKHMREKDDVKGIRNLVARLTPNHDRQYPKEEAIHHRELASLRNHHDLLCTLYWAASPYQQPLVPLIQGLVSADRSHNEACLLNLRAWDNLTSFVTSKCMDPRLYGPFIEWQNSFFDSLCKQFLDTEVEVRQQADELQERRAVAMTEQRIRDTISKNRASTMITMCISVKAMGNAIKASKSSGLATQAFNYVTLSKAMDPTIQSCGQVFEGLISECAQVIEIYIVKVNELEPPFVQQADDPFSGDADSQESLYNINWSRFDMILPLRQNVIVRLGPIIRRFLNTSSANTQGHQLLSRLVTCWAKIVRVVHDGDIKLEAFLTQGQYAIFEQRNMYSVANTYWALFLEKLLEQGMTPDDFRLIPGFNIGLEWMLAVTEPRPPSTYQLALTTQLQQKRHFLTATLESPNRGSTQMIRAAIRRMSHILIERTSNFELGIEQKQAHRLFSDMLGGLMKSLQQRLESLQPNSELHRHYLGIVQAIITDIKSYASEFRPLTDFFIHPSRHYWPHDADPTLYAAGVVSYCIRLEQHPDKTSFELFYFLNSGWKNAVISGNVESYARSIKKGMKWWEFVKFMLAEFVPAAIETGFGANSWLLCETFLPAITGRIARVLESKDGKAAWVFEHLINLLKLIMNGIILRARQYGNAMKGIQAGHHGIIATVFKFWFNVAPTVRQYVERHPEDAGFMEEVTDPLTDLIYNATAAWGVGGVALNVPQGQLDVRRGKYSDKFVEVLVKDIEECWSFKDGPVGDRGVSVRKMNGATSQVMWPEGPLREVLMGGILGYEICFPRKDGAEPPEGRNPYIWDLY